MSPIRKQPTPALAEIPVLEDVVEPGTDAVPDPAASLPDPVPVPIPVPESVPAQPASPPVEAIPIEILSEMLTERITALTDRLLRDASAEIHTTLVSKVWEKLREEIPGLVEAALRENNGDS
ncbi:MAG TPA: hypothetical protein VFX47_01975 [Gammaproteobacteria bacterium]|nr:hypothetical protein [Gammaproteobacteria bacterium]